MSIKGFEVGGVQERYDYTALDNTPANLVQDANYVHTDNNFTNTDKTKLDGIATGANKTIIDATLTQSGQAADAKAAGDEINDLKSAFTANLIHDTASGSIANFPDGAALPVRDLSVDIEPVQEGTGDPSPDNVRPISGWTGAKVTRTGKNLLTESNYRAQAAYNMAASKIESGIKLVGTPTWRSGSGIPFRIGWVNDIFSKFGTSPKVLAKSDNSLCVVERAVIQNDGSIGVWCTTTATSSSITINFSVMVYFGNAETEVAPIQGDTYDITFPSEAGTVYGGTLDVTNGVLTVDRAQIASYAGETLPSTWISDRDVYSAGATPTTGAQVVYELATPQTYQLTPQEVETLLGTNNIWADTGDTTVDYYADPTMFVNKKIAAAVAAMS